MGAHGVPAAAVAVTARHVVLVGLMGSGKTTVGRLLATRLGRPFVDSDEVIETREGRTVREIWRTDGEQAFRELETAALQAALSADEPSVIAAAGGVVLADRNRMALREADADVVWLQADPAVLVGRAMRGDHRPLLDGDAEVDGFVLQPQHLAVLAPGYRPVLKSRGGARLMLCGGAPMDGERHVWWNFVSSSRDRINEAKRAWKAGEFALPPDDKGESIPLPEVPLTVSYP